jgi:superfamily I DNA/RNA helicase
VLTENYRSTQVILDAAARLVGYNNPHRLEASLGIDKRLRSPRPSGPPVRHFAFDTVSAEADAVAAQIGERLVAGPATARHRDPGAQQRRRRSLPARAQRARGAAPLQRQPRALRTRGDPAARSRS